MEQPESEETGTDETELSWNIVERRQRRRASGSKRRGGKRRRSNTRRRRNGDGDSKYVFVYKNGRYYLIEKD